jgi:hypothetical protein|tara:strand:- start:127 stop:357 length:231 start_codon:yes stop_codon:yes gene_type:complete
MKKEDFSPHMMYDPKTGEGEKAETYNDHLRLQKKGWVHEKPLLDTSKDLAISFNDAVEKRIKKGSKNEQQGKSNYA